jgi:cobyric acid synthase CobQ
MTARTVMIQGTASHVGKSVLTAALCRWLVRRGLRVAPFKAQNMSLNSAVTAEGGEIGRSQAFQAAACGIEAEVAMNPVLLKPMAGGRCQVVLRGRPYRITEGPGDETGARLALETAVECLADLRQRFDVVVIEGMGSPAEINLRGRDVANMRVAAVADAPVLLVGDIERGGVFAALAGTMELLYERDRARVRGFLINKYHGDREVLRPGLEELQRRYSVPTVGVLPWLGDLRVDEEDAVALDSRSTPSSAGVLDVFVARLPGISNFTDLGPLEAEPLVRVRYVTQAREWDTPGLVVLPGSRRVAADLAWLQETGLAGCIVEHARRGGDVIGLCGGYQMLGTAILDPYGVEDGRPEVAGLGLLDVTTTLAEEKTLARATGTCLLPGLEGSPVSGYEIHHGVTRLGPATQPAFQVKRESAAAGAHDGACDPSGRVWGTYLHGVFDKPAFRRALLRRLGVEAATTTPGPSPFDQLADWFEQHVDSAVVLGLLEGR